jgi:hypothetical protein
LGETVTPVPTPPPLFLVGSGGGPSNCVTNVTGSIQDANGTTKYTAPQLVGSPAQPFVSALWDAFNLEETAFVLSFGTDTTLHTN